MIWIQQHGCVYTNVIPHTSMSPATRLIIIDRRALIRECIASSLRRLTRKIEIVRGADAADELQAHELACADVVMLSTSVAPAVDAPVPHEITRLFFERPDVPIALLGDSLDADQARHVVSRWRLRGYIPTSSTLAAAEAALSLIVAGGTYLPPAGNDAALVNAIGSAPPDPTVASKLTARERMVLLLLREGMPNKIIAHRLGISPSTVKAHIHSIMTKLHARNRTETVVRASAPLAAIPLGADAAKRGRHARAPHPPHRLLHG